MGSLVTVQKQAEMCPYGVESKAVPGWLWVVNGLQALLY